MSENMEDVDEEDKESVDDAVNATNIVQVNSIKKYFKKIWVLGEAQRSTGSFVYPELFENKWNSREF